MTLKITLISLYPDIASIGLRILSSVLKQNDFDVQMVFLPNIAAETNSNSRFVYQYKQETIAELIETCADSSLVGIGVMTNYFQGAVQITDALKKNLSMPVIWGGIHPTIRPEESLDHADIVCIGEGEDALLELVQAMKEKKNECSIKNLWFKKDGRIIKNPVRPLIQDLDSLPFCDYDLNCQILEDKKILPMDASRLEKALARTGISEYLGLTAYQTMASRGCPHNCTYCCNSTLRRIYGHQKYVRRRSVEHLMDELITIKSRFPFIQAVWLSDDSFFATTDDEIKQFSLTYKEKVGLPFYCLGSPTTINENKIKYLVDAGMVCIQMGIQTGSLRVCKEIYHRRISNKQVLKAARIINTHNARMLPPFYDFILDNPYETQEDILATLDLILRLPKPYKLQLFSLVLYPGTQLYEKAKTDGYVTDDKDQIYQKMYKFHQTNYLNFIFSLLNNNFPKSILRILIQRHLVTIFNRKSMEKVFGLVLSLGKRLKSLGKILKSIAR